jgi:hypothetical protein
MVPFRGSRQGQWGHPSHADRSAYAIKTFVFSLRADYLLNMLADSNLREALTVLGDLLQDRGVAYDIVVIGGGALLLLGLIDRPTKDLDVVARVEGGRWLSARPFPEPLAQAVRDVAEALDLPENWMNPGPADLMDFGLPEGFAERARPQVFGGLAVRFATRSDQIAFKLYASADHWPDRSRHLADLHQLAPSTEELLSAAAWCRSHDPSEGFRDMLLLPVLAEFGLEDPDV